MQRTALILLTAVIFLAGLTLPRASAETPAVKSRDQLDLRYHPGTDGRHVLDIFRPEFDAPAPVIVFVHGGAWIIGDKSFFGLYRGVARWLAKQGYVVVMINYRLSPQVQHPEHARDVARAFAWVRGNIKNHGGDPERIVLAGHSAGGHLSTLVGTAREFLTDADRAVLRGVVGISGAYRIPDEAEFLKAASALLATFTGIGGKAIDAVAWLRPGEAINPLRMAFGSDKAVLAAASPINHIRRDLPPILLLYAGLEIPPLGEQAVEYSEALRQAGVDVNTEKMPGADHNSILFFVHRPNNPTAKALLAFLQRTTGVERR